MVTPKVEKLRELIAARVHAADCDCADFAGPTCELGLAGNYRAVADSVLELFPDAAQIPGFAWAYTITFDGDTHWLECDFCAALVKPVEAGDSLEAIVTRARDHERTCAG